MKSGKVGRQMFEWARQVIPRGVTSNFRYWGDDETLVLKRAEGAYIWDQDDRRYSDYRLGFGPVVLGHAHGSVTARVREALEIGNTFAMMPHHERRSRLTDTTDSPCNRQVSGVAAWQLSQRTWF